MTGKRWLFLLLVLAALVFGVQAGEYSTPQWLSLRAREKELKAEVSALAREVDSLTAHKKLVETDPVTQERIAREQYGMLRRGEIEFTVVPPRQ